MNSLNVQVEVQDEYIYNMSLREAKLFGKKIKALAPMVQNLWPKTKTVKLNAT